MAEKTEQPTAKKLRDARQKGQVAHSKDFTQTMLMLALFGWLIADAGPLFKTFGQMLLLPTGLLAMPFEQAAGSLLTALAGQALHVLLPFIGIVVAVSLLAEMLQVGVLFAFDAIKPSGRRLDVAENLKNMLSARSWVELLKSVLKVLLLSGVIVLLLHREIGGLVTLPRAGIDGVAVATGALMLSLFKQVGVAYAVMAGFDLVYQRVRYRRQLMMSKDEVQREYKEMEGDPHVRHQRRQLHQELLAHNAVQAARQASVIVTNPTHLAVALRYDDEVRTPLPLVLAKAEGALAARMVQAAREAGVPVMQNIPLARALMQQAEVERWIPVELVEPVAELLRALRELQGGEPAP